MSREYGPARLLTPEQLTKEFPYAERWHEDKSIMLFLDGKLLPDDEAKIEMFGGAEKIKAQIDRSARKYETTVLFACRQTPLPGYEICRFGYGVGYPMGVPTAYENLSILLDSEKVKQIEELLRVSKQGDVFNVRFQNGYVTTNDGTKAVSDSFVQKNLLSRLPHIPILNPRIAI